MHLCYTILIKIAILKRFVLWLGCLPLIWVGFAFNLVSICQLSTARKETYANESYPVFQPNILFKCLKYGVNRPVSVILIRSSVRMVRKLC